MEKEILIGKDGDLDLKLENGKAVLAFHYAIPNAAVNAGIEISLDAGALIDKLAAAVDKMLPAENKIDDAVFAIIKSAVSKI